MGQIQFMTGLASFLIFTIAIMAFAYNFGIDNNAGINVVDDDALLALNNTLEPSGKGFLTSANSTTEALYKSTTTGESGVTTQVGSFQIGLGDMIGSVKNTITSGYRSLFGSSQGFGIVLTIFIGLIGSIGLLYVWKSIKGGIPD